MSTEPAGPERRGGLRARVADLWNGFDGLAGDTIWGAFSDVGLLIVTFLSFILLQEVLPNVEFGGYSAMYAVIGPLGAMGYAGPGLALLQKRLRDKAAPDPTLRRFLSLTLIQGVGLTAVATGIILVIADVLTPGAVLLIAISELIANSTIFVVSMLVQASSGYPAMVRVRLGLVVIRFVVLLGLAGIDERFAVDTGQLIRPQIPGVDKFEALTIFNLGLAYSVGFGLYAIWLVVFHLPRHGYRVSFGKPGMETVKAGAKFSVPMAAAEFQTNGDKAALQGFGYGEENGLYSVAYRIVLLGLTPLKILDGAAFQRFLSHEEGRRGQHLERSIKFTGLMVGAAVLAAGFLFLVQPWLGFLIAEDKEGARDMLPWIIPLIPLVALRTTPLNGLVGLGREFERSIVYVSASVMSLILYLLLIPPYGWVGALIATFLSEAYLSCVAWFVLFRYQRIADAELPEEPPVPVP
ncbi:MAG: lipopolysaccharide biosynthesis protein [Actinomycetota bacterium]